MRYFDVSRRVSSMVGLRTGWVVVGLEAAEAEPAYAAKEDREMGGG